MKETILYYPTISIPSGEWLRQAILYWDEIGSIVPQRYDDTEVIPYTPEVQFLKSEGEFRPFRPQMLFQGNEFLFGNFEKELIDKIASSAFQNMLAPPFKRRYESRVHREKISDLVFHILQDAGLARVREGVDDWFYFETRTALLYMSILAKYLALADQAHTIAGSNHLLYEQLNFSPAPGQESVEAISIKFSGLLPVPTKNNSIQDLLVFKRRRKDQLLKFRKTLRDFQRKLAKSKSSDEIRSTMADFELEISVATNDLSAVMEDARLGTRSGVLKSLLTASPGTIGLLAAGYPVPAFLAGAAVGISTFLIDREIGRRAALRNSPVAYLYSAKQANVI